MNSSASSGNVRIAAERRRRIRIPGASDHMMQHIETNAPRQPDHRTKAKRYDRRTAGIDNRAEGTDQQTDGAAIRAIFWLLSIER